MLHVLNFVNVSNPASVALATLLTAAAPTVQAAAAGAVAASIAASVVAGALGGAAGGGGGPAGLAGAQVRSGIYIYIYEYIYIYIYICGLGRRAGEIRPALDSNPHHPPRTSSTSHARRQYSRLRSWV